MLPSQAYPIQAVNPVQILNIFSRPVQQSHLSDIQWMLVEAMQLVVLRRLYYVRSDYTRINGKNSKYCWLPEDFL